MACISVSLSSRVSSLIETLTDIDYIGNGHVRDAKKNLHALVHADMILFGDNSPKEFKFLIDTFQEEFRRIEFKESLLKEVHDKIIRDVCSGRMNDRLPGMEIMGI